MYSLLYESKTYTEKERASDQMKAEKAGERREDVHPDELVAVLAVPE